MAPAASLPKPGERSMEDDWTRITDPKEKKRAQNRVAQRKYRHRMKARLGELEARLGSGQNATSQENPPNSKGPEHATDGHDNAHATVGVNITPDTTASGDPRPRDGHETQSPSPTFTHDPSSLSHSDCVEVPASLEGKPGHEKSQVPEAVIQASDGFAYPASLGEGPTKQFILDCLRFQNKLIDRLSIQIEPGCSDEDMYDQIVHEMSADGVTQTEHINTIAADEVRVNTTSSTFKDPAQFWKSETSNQRARLPQSSSDSTNFSLANVHVKPAELMAPYAVSAPSTGETASSNIPAPHEKIHDVLLYAKNAGFDSFDDLVKEFYSHSLSDSSPLAAKQHLNRKRGLPKVVAGLFEAAEQWSSWERHGFHEEILKAAELLLRSESSATRDALQARVMSLTEQSMDGNQITASGHIKEVNNFIQHNLSNLWALSMGLVSDTGISWEGGRQNSALAVILLLQLPNEIPQDQLLRLLRKYLIGLES